MPRLRVIVLDQTEDDPNTYNYIIWADLPMPPTALYQRQINVARWPPLKATQICKNGSVIERFGQASNDRTSLSPIHVRPNFSLFA
jgi:hypothetical protein